MCNNQRKPSTTCLHFPELFIAPWTSNFCFRETEHVRSVYRYSDWFRKVDVSHLWCSRVALSVVSTVDWMLVCAFGIPSLQHAMPLVFAPIAQQEEMVDVSQGCISDEAELFTRTQHSEGSMETVTEEGGESEAPEHDLAQSDTEGTEKGATTNSVLQK